MAKISAGILVFRNKSGAVEVLIVHPGGPFWANKDDGAWSIFKGECEDNESAEEASKREFKEETSHNAPTGDYIDLGENKLKSDKIIKAWAVEAEFDAKTIKSNSFEMEWPPKSGKKQEFPENDRAEWFEINKASVKMNTGQSVFIERLAQKLGIDLKESELEGPNQQQLL
jgi:predicted NUDIX family NTP pyrophosphohydrolase